MGIVSPYPPICIVWMSVNPSVFLSFYSWLSVCPSVCHYVNLFILYLFIPIHSRCCFSRYLYVIRCARSSCVNTLVILCIIMFKDGQIGNTGIRHNRKKTVSPLRSVIVGFHCSSVYNCKTGYATVCLLGLFLSSTTFCPWVLGFSLSSDNGNYFFGLTDLRSYLTYRF